ncbi:MAG: hypothetical protein LBS59_00545 [Puniceicoccales bacterium]|jgi:hypothetical protein|nr:hypothetical protein [Puniceicoccales bacterium]
MNPCSAYVSDTPRFFPALRRARQVETYTIQPNIVERALKEVAWFLVAIIFIEIIDAFSRSVNG